MKKTVILMLAGSLAFFTGCFDYEETLVIKEDRSGTIEMRYSMDKEYLRQMQFMLEVIEETPEGGMTKADPEGILFSRSRIEEALKARNAGVRLLFYETSETDISRIWNMNFSFDDIDSLDALADAISWRVGDVAPEYDAGSVYIKQADGTWLFSRPLRGYGPEDETSDDDDSVDVESYDRDESMDEDFTDEGETGEPQMNDSSLGAVGDEAAELPENFQKMVEGMGDDKIRITVKFPGRIIESNATSVESNSATWEYTLDQMPGAPSEMRAIIKP